MKERQKENEPGRRRRGKGKGRKGIECEGREEKTGRTRMNLSCVLHTTL